MKNCFSRLFGLYFLERYKFRKAMKMRLFLFFALIAMASNPALAQTKRIVALGDSLTAGYGLQSGEDFASKLQESLIREGLDVRIDNAGVSGDTTGRRPIC